MDNQFGRKIKRTRGRSRFYSSMNYDEYVDYFGVPDTPHFKYFLSYLDLFWIQRTFQNLYYNLLPINPKLMKDEVDKPEQVVIGLNLFHKYKEVKI